MNTIIYHIIYNIIFNTLYIMKIMIMKIEKELSFTCGKVFLDDLFAVK